MDEYIENLERIVALRFFKGGDYEDSPICDRALDEIKFIVEECKRLGLPQPEISPWAGGDGVQAEWEYDWYLEIDCSSRGVEALLLHQKDYQNAIQCKFDNAYYAILLIKEFLLHVVDLSNA